jgi:hypothetical protein
VFDGTCAEEDEEDEECGTEEVEEARDDKEEEHEGVEGDEPKRGSCSGGVAGRLRRIEFKGEAMRAGGVESVLVVKVTAVTCTGVLKTAV